jgi:DNA-binding transcriptional LysR family regulator
MKPDFDLRQLEIFRKIVELGSFSRAADAVGLAQASVSERIEKLEGAVGAKLLDRLGRRVTPTRAGDLLYRHALALLEMKRTACLEMEDFLGVRKGELSLGCSTIPGEYILPKVLGRFGERFPHVTISLTIADSSEIEARVLEGRFELGVIGSKSSGNTLLSRELWEDELVLAVPASHPWAQRKSVSVEELPKVPFLSRGSGSGTLRRVEEYFQTAGVKGVEFLRIVARFSTSTAVKEGIKAGLGVSILSSLALDTELQAGLLKKLKIKGLPLYRRFYLIQDRRRTASPVCKAFVDHLLSSLKEGPDARPR